MKYNLGCGKNILPGWINVDLVPFSKEVYELDIRNLDRLPDFNEGSADHILLKHVIEHFNLPEIKRILGNCYYMLKEDGILEISTPDFGLINDGWLSGEFSAEYLSKVIYGWYANVGEREDADYMYHKLIFDRAWLRDILMRIGFDKVEINDEDTKLKPSLCMSAIATK